MKDVQLRETETQINDKQLLGKVPKASEYDTLLEPPCKLWLDDRLVAVYDTLSPTAMKAAHRVSANAKMHKSQRTNGLRTASAIFGALPRVSLRQNYCRFTQDSIKQKDLYKTVLLFSKVIRDFYEEHLPEDFARHQAMSDDEILDEWRIKGTPFTAVNFNRNISIRYHYDAANQPGVFSNVIIARKAAVGGYLVLPKYRLALSQRDAAIIIFDGQGIMHGVTPMELKDPNGYRCSIVLYALREMRNCYPFGEELERAKQWRTKVESHYRPELKGQTTGGLKPKRPK